MNIYVDESGSMTDDCNYIGNKYFVVTFIIVENPNKLRRIHKRFIQKYMNELKALDNGKMFDKDSNFIELKGSSFSPEMKVNFIKFFCKNDLFKIIYVKVDNQKVNKRIYENKARAFNLIVLIALECLITKFPDVKNYIFNIDERNLRNGTKILLEDNLIMQFCLKISILDNVSVQYFDSQQNRLIQLADVFSNIYYSNLINDNYRQELIDMRENGYIIDVVNFPE